VTLAPSHHHPVRADRRRGANVALCACCLSLFPTQQIPDGYHHGPQPLCRYCLLVFFYPSLTICHSSEATHFSFQPPPTITGPKISVSGPQTAPPFETRPLLSSHTPASVYAKHMLDEASAPQLTVLRLHFKRTGLKICGGA